MTETEALTIDARKDKMAVLFRKRASDLAGRKSKELIKERSIPVLVFWIGNERYALNLEDLSGLLSYENCTPVPKSDEMICGVINIQGELHSVIELSLLLGLSAPQQDDKGYIIVLKRSGVGLRVHRVDQILNLRKKDQAISETEGDNLSTQYSKGLLRSNIIWLDTYKILSDRIFIKQ